MTSTRGHLYTVQVRPGDVRVGDTLDFGGRSLHVELVEAESDYWTVIEGRVFSGPNQPLVRIQLPSDLSVVVWRESR